ncbi:MAG TPA: methyltransferase domain-containing protein, partial [Nakamurella sp.]|nr:methyltransferase domain-containing protein [Nakamurella sp.]
MTTTPDTNELRDTVRDRYAAAARAVTAGSTATCCGSDDTAAQGSCCGPADSATASCCGPAVAEQDVFGATLYAPDETQDLPEEAVLASLGCGNPTAVAALRPGERVLDLGSGGGIDVLLSARRVGETGFAYGVDMTDEMLELARANAARAGATNVEFLKGHIEAIPLPADSVDVVISNCVVNLAADKSAVFA